MNANNQTPGRQKNLKYGQRQDESDEDFKARKAFDAKVHRTAISFPAYVAMDRAARRVETDRIRPILALFADLPVKGLINIVAILCHDDPICQ